MPTIELADTEGKIKRLEDLPARLFWQKAPATVVEKERQRLETFKETAQKLKQQLGSLIKPLFKILPQIQSDFGGCLTHFARPVSFGTFTTLSPGLHCFAFSPFLR
jgi:hypothetical protein